MSGESSRGTPPPQTSRSGLPVPKHRLYGIFTNDADADEYAAQFAQRYPDQAAGNDPGFAKRRSLIGGSQKNLIGQSR